MSTLGFVLACVALAFTQAHRNNPIEKAVQMISNLQQMILSQAADAQKTYRKYTAYCEERSQNLMYDIKGEKAEVSSLKAVISSNTAAIGVLRAKIEEISSEISSIDDQEKAADAMRVKEASNFGSEEGGETPVSIPNTEVKSPCAYGTAGFPGGRVGRCRRSILSLYNNPGA